MVLRLHQGDIFSIPIDDRRHAIGQIVGTYEDSIYYFAIYDYVWDGEGAVDVHRALDSPLLFLALSMDAKLYVGDWVVIGHGPVPENIPFPAYKEQVGTPDNIDVVDFTGERRRKALPAEVEALSYRKVVAPVRLEKAVRALHQLEPWAEAYAAFVPNEAVATSAFFC